MVGDLVFSDLIELDQPFVFGNVSIYCGFNFIMINKNLGNCRGRVANTLMVTRSLQVERKRTPVLGFLERKFEPNGNV